MGIQTLDLFVVFCCVIAAVGGYRLGFVTRVASWVGLIIGLLLAIRILPAILRSAENASDTSRLGLVVLLLLLGAIFGQMLGMLAGAHLSRILPKGNWKTVDRVVGSVAGVLGVLILVWAVIPSAVDVPGWPAQQARSSKIAQAIDQNSPQPPNALKTLRKLVGSQNFQPVFDKLGPSPDAGRPPESVTLPAATIAAVKQSTVKVEGTACRRTQNGSGFAVAPNLFVTNAHVVAGEDSTTVISPDGKTYGATVVAFDSNRDLALLRVSRYSPTPLEISNGKTGDVGAVFGHPGGQEPIEVSPASISDNVTAVGRDLYDKNQTRRSVLVLSSQLRQGDSGAPFVNADGKLIGIAFAIAPDNPNTAYALATSELRGVLAGQQSTAVSTGDCLRD